MKQRVLIIGANSDIAQSCSEGFNARGCEVIWAAHKLEDLPDSENEKIFVDLNNAEDSLAALRDIECDIVVYSAGKLATNEATLLTKEGAEVRAVNYATPVALLGMFAEQFLKKKKGVIVGISSVAADRGKASNVVYGSAKAGFDHFLGGLRQYVHPHGVRVLTIRPGYVRTKMTAGMPLPNSLTASKEQVASKVVKHALSGSRNIVYVKSIWRPLMWVLKHIPERIFKRKVL